MGSKSQLQSADVAVEDVISLTSLVNHFETSNFNFPNSKIALTRLVNPLAEGFVCQLQALLEKSSNTQFSTSDTATLFIGTFLVKEPAVAASTDTCNVPLFLPVLEQNVETLANAASTRAEKLPSKWNPQII